MAKEFSKEDRRRLAAVIGKGEPYLYQCLTGRRDMSPSEARRAEDATRGELRRWHLCQKTWFLIWPELMREKGAPKVPAHIKAPLAKPRRKPTAQRERAAAAHTPADAPAGPVLMFGDRRDPLNQRSTPPGRERRGDHSK